MVVVVFVVVVGNGTVTFHKKNTAVEPQRSPPRDLPQKEVDPK